MAAAVTASQSESSLTARRWNLGQGLSFFFQARSYDVAFALSGGGST